MRLSVRSKLILIMSLVVGAATFGTSWVSQGIVRRAYEQRFKDDFKAEVRFFSERQLGRLAEMREHCRDLAKKVTLGDAIEKRDAQALRALVFQELHEFYLTPPPAGPNARDSRPFAKKPPERDEKPIKRSPNLTTGDRPVVMALDANDNVICIINGEGKIATGEEAKGFQLGRPASPERRKLVGPKGLTKVERMMEKVGDEQAVDYAVFHAPDGSDHLREQVITPVLREGRAQPVGALIVSTLMNTQTERQLRLFSLETDRVGASKDSGISSGFWFNGVLQSETIPASARSRVSDAVAKKLAHMQEDAEFHDTDISLLVDNQPVPHKILFRVLNPGSPFSPACHVAMYSLRDEIAEERLVLQKISSIGLGAFAVALMLVWLIGRSLTRPIHELAKGTKQIRAGNYEARVDVHRQDELGDLARSFNEMAAGLQLNKKYQRLLGQVADRSVAEQLMNNETALGGELRHVSVLFCDIRGFTKLTEGMPPQQIIAMLNEHMTALTSIIYAHGGVVDKFVGDMVMALFGVPTAHSDDTHRAARCALRMVQAREELNARGQWKLTVGIGIATGEVVAGCMGSEERLDYTVLGDRVNLASRLCSQAEHGEVLIDDNTRDGLGLAADTEALGEVELRGFDQPMKLYRLWGYEAHATPTVRLTMETETSPAIMSSPAPA